VKAGLAWTILATVGAAALLVPVAPLGAQDPSAGEQTYIATCSGCHGADGSGNPGVFPPLVDNPNALDSAYVTDVIGDGLSGPITVNEVDYDSAMPAFGQLSDAEVADIVAFLGTNFQGPGTESPTTTGPAGSITPPAGGDADRGEDLFVGATDLANGGPACAACHKAGGRGNLGGSSLGPDLTGAVELYGGTDGLMAVIATPAFRVMNEVYADTPLTEQETADLAAFLVRASGEEDKDSGDALLIIGSVGAAVLFGAMVIFRPFSGAGYSRRLRRNS
jgi:mono/diheme cytochrome c family protein